MDSRLSTTPLPVLPRPQPLSEPSSPTPPVSAHLFAVLEARPRGRHLAFGSSQGWVAANPDGLRLPAAQCSCPLRHKLQVRQCLRADRVSIQAEAGGPGCRRRSLRIAPARVGHAVERCLESCPSPSPKQHVGSLTFASCAEQRSGACTVASQGEQATSTPAGHPRRPHVLLMAIDWYDVQKYGAMELGNVGTMVHLRISSS